MMEGAGGLSGSGFGLGHWVFGVLTWVVILLLVVYFARSLFRK